MNNREKEKNKKRVNNQKEKKETPNWYLSEVSREKRRRSTRRNGDTKKGIREHESRWNGMTEREDEALLFF